MCSFDYSPQIVNGPWTIVKLIIKNNWGAGTLEFSRWL